jgi:hypothetical protein
MTPVIDLSPQRHTIYSKTKEAVCLALSTG